MGIAMDLIMTAQVVHLTPVMRLYMPSCLMYFFKHLEVFNLQGFLFGYLEISGLINVSDLSKTDSSVSYIFQRYGTFFILMCRLPFE